MKAIATLKIDSTTGTNFAMNLIQGFTRRNEGELVNDNCFWGSTVELDFPGEDTMRLTSITVSGTTHSLTVTLGDEHAEFTVIHDGARNSYGPRMEMYLPFMWRRMNNIADGWELDYVESSQPKWAVEFGLLRGRFGYGPANLKEYEIIQDCHQEAIMREAYRVTDREWPADLYCECSTWYVKGEEFGGWYPKEYKIPTWTGVEYRRAAAMGVTLP